MTVVTEGGGTGLRSGDVGILAPMNRFGSVREAKNHLIGEILTQAKRDGVPVSDIERKMLYFTETGWTLPDMMAISQEFDRDYDQNEYETKVGQIVRRAREQPDCDRESWNEAVRRLRDEDHYLSVLIDVAARGPAKTSGRDKIKLTLAGVAVVAVFLPASFFVYDHVGNQSLADVIVETTFVALALLAAFIASRGPNSAA